jgi:glyoxylase-like metal-dependent hydrolase (beta-lactamase superfamily II)
MHMNPRSTMAMAVMVLMFAGATAARAQTPMVRTQAPGYYRLMLGQFEITALLDGTDMLPAASFLINTSGAEVQHYLAREYLSDPVETSINAFLVNTGAKLVLIDTGTGSYMGPRTGHLLASLRAAGYEPGQIDEIYLTHMHGDHIGGLSSAGTRAFPNALVRASRLEADYWLNPEHLAHAAAEQKEGFEHAQESLAPYVKAGKFSVFEDGAALVSGITSVATHGHTPGHTSYMIQSQGARLLVLGDLVHFAAVQFPKPSVAVKFDIDSKAAVMQREKVLHDAAEDGYWIAAEHVSFPGLGHVRAEGSGYVWLAAAYSIPH